MKVKTKQETRGFIMYEGKSLLGGDDQIVCIAVLKSENKKTGKMVQVYIIPKDVGPIEAIKAGKNFGACGTCPLQGEYALIFKKNGGMEKRFVNRVCYVNLGHGPSTVYQAYMAGKYKHYVKRHHEKYIAGRKVRIGAYGDPAAIPLKLVKYLAYISSGWTGYSHQMFWVRHAAELANYVMASCHTPAQHAEARRRGWRSFVAIPKGGQAPERSVECPHYTHGVNCETCLLCDGNNKQAKDVYVIAHAAVGNNLQKVINKQGDKL
jgi:hypothetical protein